MSATDAPAVFNNRRQFRDYTDRLRRCASASVCGGNLRAAHASLTRALRARLSESKEGRDLGKPPDPSPVLRGFRAMVGCELNWLDDAWDDARSSWCFDVLAYVAWRRMDLVRAAEAAAVAARVPSSHVYCHSGLGWFVLGMTGDPDAVTPDGESLVEHALWSASAALDSQNEMSSKESELRLPPIGPYCLAIDQALRAARQRPAGMRRALVDVASLSTPLVSLVTDYVGGAVATNLEQELAEISSRPAGPASPEVEGDDAWGDVSEWTCTGGAEP